MITSFGADAADIAGARLHLGDGDAARQQHGGRIDQPRDRVRRRMSAAIASPAFRHG